MCVCVCMCVQELTATGIVGDGGMGRLARAAGGSGRRATVAEAL